MRRTAAILLIILTLVSLSTQAIEAEVALQPIASVQRDIKIIKSGIIFMNDTFTLEAPSDSVIMVTEVQVGFQSFLTDERRRFEIWQDNSWKEASYSESNLGDERFHGYEIQLSSPVTLQDGVTLKFRASYLFLNEVSKVSSGYSTLIPVYPAIMYNISNFKLHVLLPSGAEFLEVSSALNFTHVVSEGLWTLEQESEAIGPFTNENATITYAPSQDDEYLLDYEKLGRHVIIKQGSIRVEDTHTIINTGGDINSYHIRIPSNSSNIKAKDGVGPLSVRVEEAGEGEDYVDVFISPRAAFRGGDRWSFTVGYTLSKSEYLTSEEGTSTLTFSVYGFSYYVRELSAVVTLPEGASLVISEPEFSSIKKTGLHSDVFIELGVKLPSEQPKVVITFNQSIVWSVVRPLGLLLTIFGVIGSVYIMRKRRHVEERKPAEVKRLKRSDFLDHYMERLSLLSELEVLERNLEAKEVSRDRYNRRTAEINRRQGELKRILRQLSKAIEVEYPDLVNPLKEVRRAEGEIDRVNDDLRNLEVRLRARRVSRRDYGRRRRDHLRRRSRAVRRIEQALSSIRDEN